MALEIGDYRGDGQDLAQLIMGTWTSVYGGRAWFPVWDTAYIAWRLLEPRILDREMLTCAYDGDRLIGCLLGEQTDLRIGSRVAAASLLSYLSVDPTTPHRGVALRMLARQQELHRKRGLELGLGVSNSRPEAESRRFWAAVGRRTPAQFALLGGFTMWAAMVDAGAVARAGLDWFDRFGSRAAALVAWGWVGARGARTRSFRADDLTACRRLIHRQGEAADCQMIWSMTRLAVQLDHAYARTWITERYGQPSGVANGYLIDWSGAAVVRVGFIEVCACDRGVFAQAALLVAAGRALATEGAQMVVVLDGGCQPRAALLAAGFLPMNPHVQKMALLGEMARTLPSPARLHCAFT